MKASLPAWARAAAPCAFAALLLAGCAATPISDPAKTFSQALALSRQCIDAVDAAPGSSPPACARLASRFGNSPLPEAQSLAMDAQAHEAGLDAGDSGAIFMAPGKEGEKAWRAKLGKFVCRWRGSPLAEARQRVSEALDALEGPLGETPALPCQGKAPGQDAEALFWQSADALSNNPSPDDVHAAFALIGELARRFGNSPEPMDRHWVALGLFNQGAQLAEDGKPDAALAIFDGIERRFGKEAGTLPLAEPLARTGFLRADTLADMGDLKEAIAAYEAMGRRFAQSLAPDARLWAAKGLANAASLCDEMGKHDEEIALYDKIAKRFADDLHPELRLVAADALKNKYIALFQAGKGAEAAAVAQSLAQRFAKPPQGISPGEPGQGDAQVLAAEVLLDLAAREENQGKHEGALAACRQVVSLWGNALDEKLRLPVEKALLCETDALRAEGKPQEAAAAADAAIAHFEACCNSKAQRLQAAWAMVAKAAILSDYISPLDPAGALETLDALDARFCRPPHGDDMSTACYVALGNSVEPAISLGDAKGALQRARRVLAQKAPDEAAGTPAIMEFLAWLARPDAAAFKAARKAALSAPDGQDWHWTFAAMRRHAQNLAGPERAKALCFFDFFEKNQAKASLKSCLAATGLPRTGKTSK
jgi:tetratricopeptide (TPR) repeat protein